MTELDLLLQSIKRSPSGATSAELSSNLSIPIEVIDHLFTAIMPDGMLLDDNHKWHLPEIKSWLMPPMISNLSYPLVPLKYQEKLVRFVFREPEFEPFRKICQWKGAKKIGDIDKELLTDYFYVEETDIDAINAVINRLKEVSGS